MNIKELIPWGTNDVEKYKVDSPFVALEREMDRLFNNFRRSFFDVAPWRGEERFAGTLYPRVDVSETDEDIQVTAELPGLEEKDVEITLSHNILTLKGEKKSEKEEKKKNYHWMERSYGKFQRSISLPAEIEADKVDANFKKGVLTVRIPKSEKEKKEVKKISIKGE